ncbi:MAG TPA: DUF192 domain-containing protein [Clostridia bacterium]|nr:DUF192 domain-containing protein [Clostridia bacterium]
MLYNETKKIMIVDNLKIAKTFKERFLGLMFKRRLPAHEGLMLLGCSAIHTCFMRFAIDVVFMDINHRVIGIKEKIKPWQLSGFVRKAYIALELPEGTVDKKNITIGDILILG